MAGTSWAKHEKPIEMLDVQFDVDGATLRGEIFHPPDDGPWPGAILLHGMAAGRKVMRPAARELAHQGLAVLIYDLRGHGDSEGVYAGEGADDLVAAFRWFREQSMVMPERIGTVGHSVGGRIVLIAAAKEPDMAAEVALAPAPDDLFDHAQDPESLQRCACDPTPKVCYYPGMRMPGVDDLTNWRVNFQMRLNGYQLAIDWARTIDSWNAVPIKEAVKARAAKPLLLVQGTLDYAISCEQTEKIHQVARPPRDLWVIPMGFHATPYWPGARRRWESWLWKRLTAA